MSKKIFVVEDDAGIREGLLELLEDEGYRVTGASEGREALKALQEAAEQPDLILLDLMMPGMDGYQFREEQAKDPRIAGIPVVVMSAGGQLEEKCKRVGACDFVRKPLDIDQLLATLSRAAG